MTPLALFLYTFVATATAAQLPSCATTCIAKAIQKTGCAAGNTQCLCESQHYVGYLRHCSTKRCNKSDTQIAIQSVNDLCGLVSHAEPDPSDVENELLIQARNEKHGKSQPKEDSSEHHWPNAGEPYGPFHYSHAPEPSFYSHRPQPSFRPSVTGYHPHASGSWAKQRREKRDADPSYYSPEPNPSYYTSAPVASFYTSVPAASFYTSAPAASFYTSAPAASFYTSAPAASFYTSAPAASFYTPAPVASFYTHVVQPSFYTTVPAASFYTTEPAASFYTAAPVATVL